MCSLSPQCISEVTALCPRKLSPSWGRSSEVTHHLSSEPVRSARRALRKSFVQPHGRLRAIPVVCH
jgi:hypothetical protein